MAGSPTNGSTCPPSEPSQGSGCSVASSVACTYGTFTCGDTSQPGSSASCVDGAWKVTAMSGGCNPPAPIGLDAAAPDAEPTTTTCPTQKPPVGASCSAAPGVTCMYDLNACGDPTVAMTCEAGRWISQPIAGGCNPPAPVDGGAD